VLLGFIFAKYLYFLSLYSKNKYSLEPTTFFQVIFLIFSSISQENKSLQILTHFSTEFTKIHSTFFNLSFNGAIFASCTSSQGLIFTSKIKGQSCLSRTISHQIYQIFVTCCVLIARFKALSQEGSFSHLTSQIPGIDLIIFHLYVINVSFQVQISIHTQQAQACKFAFHFDSFVGTLSIAITGTILKAIILISGNQYFQRSSISSSSSIFFSIITLSLFQERE
jgi:hypothetical protein